MQREHFPLRAILETEWQWHPNTALVTFHKSLSATLTTPWLLPRNRRTVKAKTGGTDPRTGVKIAGKTRLWQIPFERTCHVWHDMLYNEGADNFRNAQIHEPHRACQACSQCLGCRRCKVLWPTGKQKKLVNQWWVPREDKKSPNEKWRQSCEKWFILWSHNPKTNSKKCEAFWQQKLWFCNQHNLCDVLALCWIDLQFHQEQRPIWMDDIGQRVTFWQGGQQNSQWVRNKKDVWTINAAKNLDKLFAEVFVAHNVTVLQHLFGTSVAFFVWPFPQKTHLGVGLPLCIVLLRKIQKAKRMTKCGLMINPWRGTFCASWTKHCHLDLCPRAATHDTQVLFSAL